MINGFIKKLMKHFNKEQSFSLSCRIIPNTAKCLFTSQRAPPSPLDFLTCRSADTHLPCSSSLDVDTLSRRLQRDCYKTAELGKMPFTCIFAHMCMVCMCKYVHVYMFVEAQMCAHERVELRMVLGRYQGWYLLLASGFCTKVVFLFGPGVRPPGAPVQPVCSGGLLSLLPVP